MGRVVRTMQGSSNARNPVDLLNSGQYSKLVEACKTGYQSGIPHIDFSNHKYLPKLNPYHFPRIDQCKWMRYTPGFDHPDPSEAKDRFSTVLLPDDEKRSTHDGCLSIGFHYDKDDIIRRWFGKFMPNALAVREVACAYIISMYHSLPHTPLQYLPPDQDFSNSHLFVARRFVRGRIISDLTNTKSLAFNPKKITGLFTGQQLGQLALDQWMVGAADCHFGNGIFAPKTRLKSIKGLAIIDLEMCFPGNRDCPVAKETLRKYACTNTDKPFPGKWMNQYGLPVVAGSPEFIQRDAEMLKEAGNSGEKLLDEIIDQQCHTNFFLKLMQLKEAPGVKPLSTTMSTEVLKKYFEPDRDQVIKGVLHCFKVYTPDELKEGIDLDNRRLWIVKTLKRHNEFSLRNLIETIVSESL